MLEKNVRLEPESLDHQASALDPSLTARDMLRFVRLRRTCLIVPTLVFLALAYGYLQIAVPVYSARAQVIIDPRLPQFIPGHNEETIMAWDSAQVESEIAVLSSERIAGAVVTKLGLDRDKDFRGWPSPLDRLRDLLGLKKEAPVKKPDKFREALMLIQSGLNVRRSGLSYAIDIAFSFPEAFRTSEIANAIAEGYIADQIENRSHAARVGGEWLQDRMVLLRSQMNAASRAVQIFRASHNYTIPSKSDATGAAGSGAAASSAGGTAKPDELTLDELEASASTYKKIYESFLQSYTESVQRQSFPVSDARILTPASLPDMKSAPRAGLIYALAGLVGLLAGTGIAVFQHNTDRVVRSPRQIAALGVLDDLGQVPRIRRSFLHLFWPRRSRRSPRMQAANAAIRERMNSGRLWRRRRRTMYFVGALEPSNAPSGSAFFETKTLIDLVKRREGIRTIGVTAPHAGAGSSTLASNLGSLAATSGTRTLVIDADLHGRNLTQRVGVSRGFGLIDVLTHAASLDEAVVRFWGTQLDFLPVSQRRDVDQSVLSTEAFDALLAEARKEYGLVLIDLPPLFPIGAALDLSGTLDGIVLAVEAGKTTIDRVSASAEYLTRVHARTLGFVMNKVAR